MKQTVFGGKCRKLTILEPIQTALTGTDPHRALAVFIKRQNNASRWALFACERCEDAALIYGETTVGADPQSPVAGFVKSSNKVVCEAVRCCKGTQCAILESVQTSIGADPEGAVAILTYRSH